jgi:hypothetical protein
MRNRSIYTLIIIGLLLLAVSCQAKTAEEESVIQEETPPAAATMTAQPPTDNQPSSSGLRATLEAPSSLPQGEPLKVRFTLANESESDLYVLNWFTPLEGLGGDIFRVTRDGQRIRYQGPQASRGDPTPEAYTLIEAGGMASAEVDLSLAYDFSQPGNYTIEFISPNQSHVAHAEAEMARSVDELGPVEMPSNQVVVAIGA